MRHYCRADVPGGTYFFTVVTYRRRPVFDGGENIAALRAAFRRVRAVRSFAVEAIVVLPDHLHCIWRLLEGDSDDAGRRREIKKAASRVIDPVADERNERAVWQRRYWEHVIRDEVDWRRHVDYIHYNPVKHGWAARPADWPWSSFSRAAARGWYPAAWGETEPEDIASLNLE